MYVYTKINGKLAVWEFTKNDDPMECISLVRDELGIKHKPTILALIKN